LLIRRRAPVISGPGYQLAHPCNTAPPMRQIQKKGGNLTPKGKAWIVKHPGSLRFKGCPKRRARPSEPLRTWPLIDIPEKGIRLALHLKRLSFRELAASVIHLDHYESCRDSCEGLPGVGDLSGYWRIHFVCLSRRVGEIALPGSNKIARYKTASLQSRVIGPDFLPSWM